jgi:hypothetical protein
MIFRKDLSRLNPLHYRDSVDQHIFAKEIGLEFIIFLKRGVPLNVKRK